MAIYTTNNTPYKGRSLQDMLVPYLMYTQRYDDIANKMVELGDLSVIWNNLLSPTRDHETWAMVNNYNERLGNTIADMLNGNIDLNTAMNRLQNMRREYNSWGTAVDNAYKQRLKFIEELRALALQPGGYHVTKPAESFSIDELMANPGASYEALSEKELYDRGKAAAEASSKRRFSTYETTRFKHEYNVLVNQNGYSLKDAAKFLADKYNIPELGKIFDNISTEYNLDRFGNDLSIDRIQLDLSIFNGILDGMVGSKSEQNFGKIEKPTLPGLPGNGSGKVKAPMPNIPLNHITQGSNQPNGNVVTDGVWMDDGKVMNKDIAANQGRINELYNELQDYQEAIENGLYLASNFSNKGQKEYVPVKKLIDKKPDGYLDYTSIIFNWNYNGKEYSGSHLKSIYNEYQKLTESLRSSQDTYNQYSYLNNTSGINIDLSPADVINIGNQLNNSTLQLKVVDYTFKIKPSQAKDVVAFYNTALTNENYYPESNESPNGIFQINGDGSLSKDRKRVPTISDQSVVIAKDSGNGLEIGFRQNGIDYAWRGDADLNQVRTEYNGMKQWLRDFTNTGVGVGVENGTIHLANTNVDKDDIYNSINGKLGVSIPGTPYFGYVIYDQASLDLVKIVADTPMFILPYYTYDPLTNKYIPSYGSHVIAKNTLGSLIHGNSKYMNDDLGEYLKLTLKKTNTWFESENAE